MRVDNELSEYVKIKRGVRQGCVYSPDLFNLYGEKIFRELEDLEGISVGEQNIKSLRFADDTALVAHTREGLQDLLNEVGKRLERRDLK